MDFYSLWLPSQEIQWLIVNSHWYVSSLKERDAGDWCSSEPQQAAEPPQVNAGQLQSCQGQDAYEFFKTLLFWAQMELASRVPVARAQKSLDFLGPPLPVALVMDLDRLKTMYRAPY